MYSPNTIIFGAHWTSSASTCNAANATKAASAVLIWRDMVGE